MNARTQRSNNNFCLLLPAALTDCIRTHARSNARVTFVERAREKLKYRFSSVFKQNPTYLGDEMHRGNERGKEMCYCRAYLDIAVALFAPDCWCAPEEETKRKKASDFEI